MNNLQRGLEELIAPWKDIPGVAACVVIKDQETIFACSGYSSLEYNLKIDQNTRFNLASVSKQFTGFAIRLLEKRGLLKLNDPMRKYLPEFPKIYNDIQIQHLLHHSSGLRDMYNIQAYSGFRRDDVHTTEQLIALTMRQTALNFTPGERYMYNNTGYVLMAEIVHRITGMDLRSFLEKELFASLGMTSTTILKDHKQMLPNFAGHYNLMESGEYTKAMENVAVVGSTNIFTTISDFALWLGNYVMPTCEPDVMMGLDLTHPFNDGSMNMYACGLEMVERSGKKIWTHSGGAGGFRTEMIFVPEAGVAVGVLSNNGTMDAVTLGGKILALVLPELAPRATQIAGVPVLDASEKEMKELAGCYRMPDGLLSTVVIAEHKLFIHTPYYPFRLPLLKIGTGHYKIDILGAEMKVEYDQAGTLCAVSSLTPLGPMHADKLPPIDLTEDELREYIGRYWSEELLNMWEVAIKGAHLSLVHPHFPTLELFPVLKDEFSSELENFEKIKFTRAVDGKVNGLEFSGDRALNIHFKRVEQIVCRD
jgi:CubicO group peptidase (beta-lactamase class C family)